MKISTKFRLKYLTLFLALGISALLSIYVIENEIFFLVLGVPILLFGQLAIFASTSEEKCPTCGVNIFNGNDENPKYPTGFQNILFNTLCGKCGSCKSKL